MTVKEAIKRLRKMPPDATLAISSEADRIDFHLVGHVELGWWDEYGVYGEFHNDGDADDEEAEWQPTDNSIRAVCFIPEG